MGSLLAVVTACKVVDVEGDLVERCVGVSKLEVSSCVVLGLMVT